MPERGIYRAASVKGYATPTNAPIYINSTDNLPHIIPIGSGTTEQIIPVAVSTSGARFAAGVGALVTGTLLVTTGLTTVLAFTASPTVQPTGTGAASEQILVPTWATGAVTVTAYSVSSVTGATTAANTSTGTFAWIAVGI